MRALPTVAMQAQEEERRAFARELHDGIVQDLAALKIALSTSHAQAHGALPCGCAAQMHGRIDSILRAARDLAVRLRPSILDDLGLVAAIRSHANRISAESDVEVYVSAELELGRLTPEMETAGFRIAQEAIANAVGHARAKGIYVRLAREEGGLVLGVQDDGCGFDVEPTRRRAFDAGHLGLSVMEQRASALGGHTDIVSSRGQGTTVTARFPLGERVD